MALRPASAHLACSRVASMFIGDTAAESEPTATSVSTAVETGLAARTKLTTSDRRRDVWALRASYAFWKSSRAAFTCDSSSASPDLAQT